MRHALCLLLDGEAQFAVCGEAVDGLDAIAKAKKLRPDVTLLDLAMPKLNGAEAVSALRQANPDVKIILFTVFAGRLHNQLAAAIGVDRVVSKADGLLNLVKCIYEVGRQTN